MQLLKMGLAVWKLWHVVRILVLWHSFFDKTGSSYFLEQPLTLARGHMMGAGPSRGYYYSTNTILLSFSTPSVLNPGFCQTPKFTTKTIIRFLSVSTPVQSWHSSGMPECGIPMRCICILLDYIRLFGRPTRGSDLPHSSDQALS